MSRRDIRIALLDDHEVVHQGLVRKLKKISGAKLALAAKNSRELADELQKAGKLLPDILLLDIELADGMDGYETTYWLREHYPGIRIVGYTSHGHPDAVSKLLNCGAVAFIDKGKGAGELGLAIRSVFQDDCFYNDFVPNAEALEKARQLILQEPGMIKGELKLILHLCSTDLTDQQIANNVCLGVDAVKKRIHALCSYFGVKSRPALVGEAYRQGLMPQTMPRYDRQTGEKITANHTPNDRSNNDL